MAQYGTIITNIGLAQIANAQITQTKVGLEYIALGDGNGAHYVPKQNQTALVHEVWRGPIAELSSDPTNSNRIIIDAVIPVTAGGFTIREIGIFDDKNNLIAVGQYPEKYKPQLSEGVSEETLIHFVIETNNADVVKLTIDPTVIIASRNYVDGKVAQVQTALTEHSGQIATTEKLGHIKPDGTTIKVDPITGVASASEAGYQLTESNGYAKDITGIDLNTVIESGFYKSVDGVTANNFPKDFIGGYNLSIENIQTANNWTYQTLVSSTFAGTTIWKRARVSGNWNTWKEIFPNKGDSGNVNLTPGTGWKVDLLTSSLSFREVNGIVFVKAYNIVPQTGYVNVITTLPLGYRPLNRTIVFSYDAGGVPYQAKILNTGQITLYSAQNTTLVNKAVDFEFSFSIFE